MSEEQTKYSRKTTFTKLSKYVFGFCLQKIIRDSHKVDPLTLGMDYIKDRTNEERAERLKAVLIWEGNRTVKNANAALNEIADEINFLIIQGGKIADFDEMERK